MRRAALMALLVLVVAAAAAPAAAYPGAPWFRPSRPYTENFPDPSLIVSGGRYYAYATATGGAYLPAMSSSDLKTWTARPAYDPGPPLNSDPFFNDALPYPAAWSPDRPVDGRLKKEMWAPGVAQIGGRFVAFYAARIQLDRDRFCLSVATAAHPLGPFEDRSSQPLWCDLDPNGSIDPQPFVDSDGRAYLLWKSEGFPGSAPTRIWSRPLDATGTGFVPGSVPIELLATSQPWEGNVIESPSMVRWNDGLYLFYSGNEHRSADYAIGYAECASPVGPCTKHRANPVVTSTDTRLGPGGSAAFIDTGGRLMLAYHWWNAPYTSYPAYPECRDVRTCTTQGQRRLAIEEVRATASGLRVGDRDAGPSFGADRAIGLATNPSATGYWIAGRTGAVVARGSALPLGAIAGLSAPVVGVASTGTGGGYWLIAADGGVFSFGDATFYGSTGAIQLNQPIVGMAATPTGNGYWFVARDGGIFSFGNAVFSGSTGAIQLNQPIVGMASSATGRGYWMVAGDGGVFTFGDAVFHGAA